MKNCVIQIDIDFSEFGDETHVGRRSFNHEHMKTLTQCSNRLAELYSQKFNSDYHLITSHFLPKEEQEYYNPGISKMQLFLDNKWIDQYDNILYVDTDAFIWPWAPNIFEQCHDEAFNVVYLPQESKDKGLLRKHRNHAKLAGLTLKEDMYIDYNFNTGVFVINRYAYDKINEILINYPGLFFEYKGDQLLLNAICFSENTDINLRFLDSRFNSEWRKSFKIARKHYVTHFWGRKKTKKPFSDRWNNYAKQCIEFYHELSSPPPH